ncbi:non-hydrolyzing UDP-N-acetylglucosamine 2-epimerase [Tautonia sociabilis]|uniref:UDP-N-acetylglucosamine 2-epimerase (non-hydrolyzing) n=1 Tax=Tautonia sociabilis TaxID=2080755 RepID=A0A432MEE0_9BACT|nr:UDP-N-acetylglucosamine 2-epimerase (non-hydrolyzing) [Tautonia sociabilis]RUL83772.1 UDP-N-acetylglucosamine 2-epimerase (non-hydrolyzing) [Tautonia sociabilis]
MASSVTVACVVGTRPEAVKMAPVIRRLRRPGSGFKVIVLATGQHRELLDRALADFGLRSDDDLGLMRPGQDLATLTARCLEAIGGWLGRARPDLVVAQGDTTSVLSAAMASHCHRIPFAHVEAGLRSGDPAEPFPEESNRVLTARLADLHFAPTPWARDNLIREGIPASRVRVVGNPVIDALRWVERSAPPTPIPTPTAPGTARMILLTSHRRENQGAPLARICAAVRTLVARDRGLLVVFPVHPSPGVRAVVDRELGGIDRVARIDPVGYPDFVALMKASRLILSDSGGVQEEAPALGRPVLVLRDRTERPEAVSAGACRLVGTDPDRIVAEAEAILSGSVPPLAPISPFGDGRASDRIARALADWFGLPAEDPSSAIGEDTREPGEAAGLAA